MSLHTDSIFIAALANSDAVTAMVDDRIFGTAIPVPDEELLNTPVPYVVVTFDGLTNSTFTKDDGFEGDEDMVTVGIEVVAETLDGLHTLSEAVREAVRTYFENYDGDDSDLVPLEYVFSAGRIDYDSIKPCYWQTLSYQCTTSR